MPAASTTETVSGNVPVCVGKPPRVSEEVPAPVKLMPAGRTPAVDQVTAPELPLAENVTAWVQAVDGVSFDIAALELYAPLIAGATVVVATQAQAQDPAWLGAALASGGKVIGVGSRAAWCPGGDVLPTRPGAVIITTVGVDSGST